MARHKELDDEKVLQDIYNAAVEIIDREGLDKISVRKICNMAGISTGTFYHFYPTKNDLITRLIDHMENYYKDDVIPYLEGTALEKLKTLIMAYVKRVIRRGLSYARWNAEYRTYCNLSPADYDGFFKSHLYKQIAQEAIDNGETNGKYTAHQIATMATTVGYGCLLQYTTLSGQIDLVRYADPLADVFIDGIRK
ncbi:MAG: TetR/AcrR family transcriptional regulator [Oscillospiraceae bacterium]|nr:TetR/AcrR family transcriptional regulator [Oscillospiraceae bacterium]